MKRTIFVLLLTISALAFADAKPFIPKLLQSMPDSYGVKILYITGDTETFDLASHSFSKDTQMFEFVTKDDVWNWVPMSSVKRMEFDKRFSKIVALKEEEMQKAAKKDKK